MERDKLEQKLWSINKYHTPIIGDTISEILAEFGRLKLRVASLAVDLWDANAALDEAQSWLGTITEPATNGMSDLPGPIGLWHRVQDYLDSQEKPRPADSHKRSNHVHSDDSVIFWVGQEADCPICKPLKCEHKNAGVE